MSIRMRNYTHPSDYWAIDRFLIEHYQPGNADGNWIEPAWEYMHFHSMLDSASLGKIGIWEEEGKIAAVAHYEWRLGEAFFQFQPACRHLRQELLEYAEAHLFSVSEKDGRKYLCAYVNDTDPEFTALVQSRGYEKHPEDARPLYQLEIPHPFPPVHLPDGFHITSLADECDWVKVNRVLYRGFDHEGEPPESEQDLLERQIMFDTPSGRRDLKIAVVAPDGNFVAFCGMFYEPTHRYAYVEPVATDPDYRRMGLGKAAVLEGIRRCGTLGATVAYVGSDQAFYQAIGFKKVYLSECWVKYL
ncbi:MAG: GNAT family N-acetyltransferase [Anaerolineales bacterium]|nr:GNAT family N-acetyltransferase [Anaerolineales bacterium]